MNVQSTYRGRTYKEVTIENVPDDGSVSEDMLIGYAMRHVDETPERLFDYSVKNWPMTTTWTVQLHTD